MVVVEEAVAAYPEFAAASVGAGVCSFLAAPLLVRGTGKPHGFAALDEAIVQLFSGQASIAVANSQLFMSRRSSSRR